MAERRASSPGRLQPDVLLARCLASRGNNLLSLVFAQATPDTVRLMHLKRVFAAFQQSWTPRTDRFRSSFAPCPRGATFPFRMEEIRTGHAAARRVQLPIPQIGIGPRKTPGIGHRSSLLDHTQAVTVTSGNDAATNALSTVPFGPKPLPGREHHRVGATDSLTIERNAVMIKSVDATHSVRRRVAASGKEHG